MNSVIKAGGIAVIAVSLAACAPNSGNRHTGGALLGAALGGLTGAHIGKGGGRIAAIAAGTMFGALIGHGIGESLDRADQIQAQRTATTALEDAPSGRTSQWANPDSGNSGTFTPTRTYGTPQGTYCREYRQTIQVGGRVVDGYGTACRQPDGSWKIIDSA